MRNPESRTSESSVEQPWAEQPENNYSTVDDSSQRSTAAAAPCSARWNAVSSVTRVLITADDIIAKAPVIRYGTLEVHSGLYSLSDHLLAQFPSVAFFYSFGIWVLSLQESES
ncbi:hypothetical protein N7510_005568 [Penicillium lagena]|uniref:uncharacterized protein n=1 Tax=Penicillium lagena TaxID=94218 RepID=UPI00254118A4|nr:uncharacterized protein N7510_005568 [Penicillium lagena]KAJ5612374.1 hypothetical protein N7510_005568 [Penicillium lagena]